ncbi:UbiA family prenyltransferase [Planctomicrobium sp. SH661]|uniref:UbiA family prenyltransferase n=1 Tax=Planctomicrobium sp. SH661 TaxID=3448124 RepID=UPI003F5C2D05
MRSNSLLPWLRLARLPAVFTALADICVGFLLTHSRWDPFAEFLLLLASSAALYLSGMVFNDVFDLRQDQLERPQRPIPSGAVSWNGAVGFGSVLMLSGMAFAGMAGVTSLVTALMLAAAILLYDGVLKHTPAGPVMMGSCRFFNILLGASSAAESVPEIFGQPQLYVAIAMGIYVTGVTWFARSEARVSRRQSLVGGLALIDLGLILLALWMLDVPRKVGIDLGPVGTADSTSTLLLWGVIAFSLNRRALIAVADPVPARVQPTIGSLLLSITTIDAMMIYFRIGPSGLLFTLCTLTLIAPAILLRRWISMT